MEERRPVPQLGSLTNGVIVCFITMFVGLGMAEIVSAIPTSGMTSATLPSKMFSINSGQAVHISVR